LQKNYFSKVDILIILIHLCWFYNI